MSSIKKQTIIYYLVLYVALLFTWARQDYIPMPARIAYLVLVFAPVLFKRVSFYFPCLVLYLTTSLLSYAGYTFMPTETSIYLLFTLIFAFASHRGERKSYYPYIIFLCILILITSVNLFCSLKIEKVTYSFLILLLLPLTIKGKERETVVELVPKVFIVSTLACAVLTLFNQQLLIQQSSAYDRLVSGSLNYTCCTLGIGFILALREFMKQSTHKIGKLFYALSMMLLIITIVLEASRGAVLAVAVSTVLIIFKQQSRIGTKIVTIILASLMVLVLYNNQFLDLLIYRIQSETGTGTGRTEIWSNKLHLFLEQSSVSSLLFGIGYDKAWNLGGAGLSFIGCHNDYLAFFIEYGFVGVLLFLVLVFYPLRAAKSRIVRIDVLPFVSYIIIVCMTLEPFSMGYLPFCFFLFFIYLRSCEQ